jgi:threonine synthase
LPVGNAGNISAIWKGIREFYNAGYVESKPMMTGIQAEGSAPITHAFRKKSKTIKPVENPETIATAIRIGDPVSYTKALDAIYDSNGYSETVSDDEILSAQKLLACTEGIGVEPASAASIAGLKKLVEDGTIEKGENIVCVVTGHLLKDPDTAIKASKEPTKIGASYDELKAYIQK